MSRKSERTFKRRETRHSECDCCETAAERIDELRQCLLGGINVVRRGKDRQLQWADAAERLLASTK